MSEDTPFSLDAVTQPSVSVPEVVKQTTVEVSLEPKQKTKLRDLHPDKFFVSQSDMKQILNKGNEKEHCPLRFVETTVTKNFKKPASLSMDCGSYFETLALGSGAGGRLTVDLPRKIISAKQHRELVVSGVKPENIVGDKTIDQLRIETQALRFEHRVKELRINLTDNNKQVAIIKHLWGNVFLNGELDIFPTPILIPEGLKMSVVDLKLTADVHSKWGDFCWGSPENMDHLQAKTYHELIRDIDLDLNPHLIPLMKENPRLQERIANGDVTFAYWIFGYKKEPAEEQEKFVWYEYDAIKKAELMEDIRKYVATVQQYGSLDSVPTNPKYELCKDCPVSVLKGGYCTDCKTTQTL